MKKTLLIIVLSLLYVSVFADVLKGRVIDAMSGEPLPDAEVNVHLQLASVSYADSWWFTIKTDSSQKLTVLLRPMTIIYLLQEESMMKTMMMS